MSGLRVTHLVVYVETLGLQRLHWKSESLAGSRTEISFDIRSPHQPDTRERFSVLLEAESLVLNNVKKPVRL